MTAQGRREHGQDQHQGKVVERGVEDGKDTRDRPRQSRVESERALRAEAGGQDGGNHPGPREMEHRGQGLKKPGHEDEKGDTAPGRTALSRVPAHHVEPERKKQAQDEDNAEMPDGKDILHIALEAQ